MKLSQHLLASQSAHKYRHSLHELELCSWGTDLFPFLLILFVPNDALTACFNWAIIQVDALRLRLEEKESFLNKKTKQLQDLTEEKGTLAGEIRDMKDMLEVKERKINVLQKKVRKTKRRNMSWGMSVMLFVVTPSFPLWWLCVFTCNF